MLSLSKHEQCRSPFDRLRVAAGLPLSFSVVLIAIGMVDASPSFVKGQSDPSPREGLLINALNKEKK